MLDFGASCSSSSSAVDSREQEEVFEQQVFYGQLQHINRLPAAPRLGLRDTTTYLLADIQPCKTNLNQISTPSNMPCYREYSPPQVIDMTCVQCLVGRIQFLDDGIPTWAIVDRSTALNHAIWADEPTREFVPSAADSAFVLRAVVVFTRARKIIILGHYVTLYPIPESTGNYPRRVYCG